MNNPTIELKAVVDSTTVLDEKKTWMKPALERFDIGSVTQNAGTVDDDGQHALAQS